MTTETAIQAWFDDPRFADTRRLHTARDVADQRGTIPTDHPIARGAAEGFHDLLRRRFGEGRSITTFGPYSPGQAVVQRRHGIEAVYLGGWATSAKGSLDEDPGPDLASYPLSAVPEEAGAIVRALLAADRNQEFARRGWTDAQRAATPAIDFRPFVIADADTGHGGDAHVRNVIRRFVEVGVPGFHIEDQRAGAKKCGHQDGKVLVSTAEQLRRLNAARFQLDVMGVPGIIVARTDAEAATLIDDVTDERDRPFVLGATNVDLPPYRVIAIVVQERLHELGLTDVRGHLLYALADADRDRAADWLAETGLDFEIVTAVGTERRAARGEGRPLDGPAVLDDIGGRVAQRWGSEARLATGAEAAGGPWDPELPRTPDGFYRFRGGLEPAIVRSIAAAPFADLLWMETATADLDDARRYAEAVHAVHPRAMLAYNLSPSFNWDTTGMDDEAMRRFPDELGRLGFVFTFITYGGHQIDGLAAEEFSAALRRDGMLALARLQRRLRLLDSPYRTPQALVGGPRGDAALMAATGRTASTRAMGGASTHAQHLVPIEPAPTVLEARLSDLGRPGLRVSLWPSDPWSERTDLTVRDADGATTLTLTWQVVDGLDGDDPTLVIALDGPAASDGELVAVAVRYVQDRTGVERVHDDSWPERPSGRALRSPQPSERMPVA